MVPVIVNSQEIVKINNFIFDNPPFEECHASTIVETPNGLVASWFGGTKEKNPDVEIWVSREINGIWTRPISVANGIQHKNKRYPTWNPVLFQIPGGPLKLYFKEGPNAKSWWGMEIESYNHGKTWSQKKRLPEDVYGPVKNKPIQLDDGTIISPSSTEFNGWRTHMEISKDLGRSWEIVGPINHGEKYNIIQPSVLKYKTGELQILCRSKEGFIMSCWSNDNGYSWGEVTSIGLPNPNSGTDAVSMQNGLQLLVYNHTGKIEGKWGGKRSPLNVAVSSDGKIWRSLLVLEDKPGEYSYPAVIQDKKGNIHITYTWKRKRIKHVVIDLDEIELKELKIISDGVWE
ncbi:exo-alpha-sialidase [Membranihabitans marinus]